MPVPPQQLLSALTQFPQETHLAAVHLEIVDSAPGENTDGTGMEFQYWPESVQDSRSSEWNPKNIPGGSHPIYQWTHGGERRISFTSVFTTDTAPSEDLLEEIRASEPTTVEIESRASRGIPPVVPRTPYGDGERTPLDGLDVGRRDVDLRTVVSWLRSFTYPYYGRGEHAGRVFEPTKCLLVMPNSKIGHNGNDHITCVMTQCDVTYEAHFPSGFPRIIEISLEFAEVVQSGAGVRFHDRSDMVFGAAVTSMLGRGSRSR